MVFVDHAELLRERIREDERQERTRQSLVLGASIAFHAMLVVIGFGSDALLSRKEAAPGTLGLPQALAERDETTPVRFYQLPPAPPEPPRAEAARSDRDSRAHGGDPAREPAATPFAAPTPPGASAAAERNGDARAFDPPAERPSLLGLRREDRGEGRAPASEAMAPLRPSSFWQPVADAAAGGESAGGGGGAGEGSEGGFVDEGALAFDTKWFDWGPYGAEMVRLIKQNWRVPDLARVGMKGIVVIRFFLLADGSVADEEIVSSSGIPPFDNAAFQAIADASPFPPLPSALGSKREGVTVRFYYNIQPD